MRLPPLPIARLVELERAGVLRWLKPYGISIEREMPLKGAVMSFAAQSTGHMWTCRLIGYSLLTADIEYTGPERPREVMLELIDLVKPKGAREPGEDDE